ncbi:MAG: KEOPS complex subunit Pcc1 [Thermocladium sp.]
MKAVFRVCGSDVNLIAHVFVALEKELRFRRGSARVSGISGECLEITITANDLTSLRSLINGVAKSVYLIELTAQACAGDSKA